MKLRVAFIQRNPECSIGSMYIASAIKEEAESQVFIANYEDDLCESVVKYKPDILAFSTFTGEYKQLLALNAEIRKHIEVFSVFGGPHPTYNPDFINYGGVDAICRGEGESPMLELVIALKNGKDFLGIRNFYFKTDKGEIIKNEVRTLNDDIDDFAFPDREIYAKYFHVRYFRDNVTKRIITGRGCPFSCTYCYNHALKKIYHRKGTYLRIRSVQNVIDELVFLKRKYQPSDFDFVDDIFGIKPKWIEEFSIKYRESVNIPFSCFSHVRLLNESYVSHLKEAGCKRVNIGLETANEPYRKKVLKRHYSNDELFRKTALLHEKSLPFITYNMILLPGDSLPMALETLKANLKCRPFYAFTSMYQPYPGTELANYAVENDFLEKEYETLPENFFTGSILRNPQKKILIRLFYLFSFTVKFRWFYPLTRILIYMPFEGLYEKIFEHYKSEIREHYIFSLTEDRRMSFAEFLLNSINRDIKGLPKNNLSKYPFECRCIPWQYRIIPFRIQRVRLYL